ncbi:Spo0E family sporulation regulatory protein-aspartic acid phosphatase [Brevibacillus sp. SIMBA_040]|uniref:Spo0E family sporulation regulatory protein-aspartic acid phosphatase n=1 Tax=unclassified Brevibacillus TaxID=2684853 RepID=UPI003977F8DE
METDDIERLDLIIEALRSELNTMAQSYKLTDPLIISLSQRIDFYLNIRTKILSKDQQPISQGNR